MPSGTAPGFRSNSSGTLYVVGQNGFSYSSSTSNIGGLDLGFSSNYLGPGFSDNRGYGFQLRCLSE
ncbi:hypothetical protein [uncultured Rikenella sp.]|uniref:hypothetical protein n=1 Tax=uncultured Rikenella sp. TaxID=368003 RepID=UPI002608FFA5|nr:hypothetical protein [uncultured Rikenella sp.]